MENGNKFNTRRPLSSGLSGGNLALRQMGGNTQLLMRGGGKKGGNLELRQMGGNRPLLMRGGGKKGGNNPIVTGITKQITATQGGSLTNVLQKVEEKKMVLSDQALVVAIAYGLLLIAVMLPIKGSTYNLSERLVAVISLLFPFFVSVYIINCMTSCQDKSWCGFWGWVFVGLTFLWALMLFLSVVYASIWGVSVPKANNVVEKMENNKENMNDEENMNEEENNMGNNMGNNMEVPMNNEIQGDSSMNDVIGANIETFANMMPLNEGCGK